MRKVPTLSRLVLVALFALPVAFFAAWSWQSPTSAPATQEGGDITGVVTGPGGPEAGVWVIAETRDLPTKLAKIVVTDDAGRYAIPDLPGGEYDVWVRGYGLVDSPKTRSRPGATLDLRATPAPDARAAAHYYPAGYWLSLLRAPAASEFPGTGPEGNGIAPNVATQEQWLRQIKSGGCTACHQLGTLGTRTIPAALGTFDSSVHAWERRVQSGQAGSQMMGGINSFGRDRVLREFADWTDRIAAGAVPPAPPRPRGVERNVVITVWDWADPKAYMHDLVSTDRRDPTINAYGPVYGATELSTDYVPVLDPRTHTASQVPLTMMEEGLPPSAGTQVAAPSPYFGAEPIWTSRANVHNPMMDERGRVWLTAAVRGSDNLPFCKAGSSHPSARVFPVQRSGRHLSVYDPATREYTHVPTCFSTHHLMFAEDANHTLWTSGGGAVIGWLDRKLFDETGDYERAQGWTPLIMDTNGNGRRDEWVEPNQPLDPAKDKRYGGGYYAVSPAPDGTVWGSVLGFPGAVVRLTPGSNPTETALIEVFEVPWDNQSLAVRGFSPRGMDIDRNGVAWVALASGHMASFDRRKCRGPLNGPQATGRHCDEGWSFWPEPLPQIGNVTASGSAEGSYYTWVDQFNTSGLGANTPINTGNASEGLLALVNGEWVVLRVPYPLGFYTKWMDGRIDDPSAGWKGRGLWATVSTRTPFHMEGGQGTTSKVFHFQMRPDPLAR